MTRERRRQTRRKRKLVMREMTAIKQKKEVLPFACDVEGTRSEKHAEI